jgi:hypothetical protein
MMDERLVSGSTYHPQLYQLILIANGLRQAAGHDAEVSRTGTGIRSRHRVVCTVLCIYLGPGLELGIEELVRIVGLQWDLYVYLPASMRGWGARLRFSLIFTHPPKRVIDQSSYVFDMVSPQCAGKIHRWQVPNERGITAVAVTRNGYPFQK